MWFAVAIIGVIGIAFGISALPGGMPNTHPPAASAPAPAAVPPPPAQPQH